MKKRAEAKAEPQARRRRLDQFVRPCRHRHTWLLASGLIEWCYECGAVRKMQRIHDTNAVCPLGKWAKPVGAGGENPYVAAFDGPNPTGQALRSNTLDPVVGIPNSEVK